MLSKLRYFALIIILVGIMGMTPLTHAQEEPDTFLYLIDVDNISIDGKLASSEYPLFFDLASPGGTVFGQMAWGHNTTHIAVGVQTFGSGWLGLGLGDVGVSMTGSDIIMGSVSGTNVILKDMYSTDQIAPEEDADSYIDDQLVAGVENSTGTTLEFIIPITSSDTDGYDHQWQTNNTYGFFAAYHSSIDDFTVYHTSHTPSLTVEILQETADLVVKLDQVLSLQFFETNSSLIISSTVYQANTTTPIEGLTIEFYQKTHFGKVLKNSSTTNSQGIARVVIVSEFEGNITIISSFAGTENVEQSEVSSSIMIEHEPDTGPETLNDIRDWFGDEHLMRSFLLICFYFVVFFILAVYFSVIFDLFRLGGLAKPKGDQKEVQK